MENLDEMVEFLEKHVITTDSGRNRKSEQFYNNSKIESGLNLSHKEKTGACSSSRQVLLNCKRTDYSGLLQTLSETRKLETTHETSMRPY